jgi:hypothetical protein
LLGGGVDGGDLVSSVLTAAFALLLPFLGVSNNDFKKFSIRFPASSFLFSAGESAGTGA